MLTSPPGPAGFSIYLLSQIDAKVEKKPIAEQAAVAKIEAQALEVAERFADFVGSATKTLDICIYDFRLDLPAVSAKIVDAINGAADRDVAVRIAFDANQKSDEEVIKQFEGAGGDPAPTGTQAFLHEALARGVRTKAIAEQETAAPTVAAVTDEPIATGSQIMHNKYMVADAASEKAKVWMGSTNFTVDAWALQDNNIVVVTSHGLAAKYTEDFEELWKAERLAHTGALAPGFVTVHGKQVHYAFAPGQGEAIRDLIAKAASRAKRRIRIASMVTSAEPILLALKAQIDAGIDFAGVYDYGQSTGFLPEWKAKSPEKAALLEAVLGHLVPKHSNFFDEDHPDYAHDFMHDKILVADDTVVTGSFNFSTNAMGNAENVISVTEPALADAYAAYIDELAARYKAH
jgi:phosphatidylserine/phosphatidylglycerophosphate/cardiolipin synthase-like enzyme